MKSDQLIRFLDNDLELGNLRPWRGVEKVGISNRFVSSRSEFLEFIFTNPTRIK